MQLTLIETLTQIYSEPVSAFAGKEVGQLTLEPVLASKQLIVGVIVSADCEFPERMENIPRPPDLDARPIIPGNNEHGVLPSTGEEELVTYRRHEDAIGFKKASRMKEAIWKKIDPYSLCLLYINMCIKFYRFKQIMKKNYKYSTKTTLQFLIVKTLCLSKETVTF